MSWSQVLNDVNARLTAASQNFQTLDTNYRQRTSSYPNNAAATPGPLIGGAMSVHIQLDQHNVPFYTNLDFVTGRVLLSLVSDTTISAITVKLEGESRTRLFGPKFVGDTRPDRQKIRVEVHKLLYKVQTVFPGPEISQNAINSQFTLPAGQYSYPFSFKMPINGDCSINPSVYQDLKLGPFLGPELSSLKHVRQTLPPALGGFPGEAEIKYFVKATVVRPKFYQENIRQQNDIKFLPIEPPRPGNRAEETYARRHYQFQPSSGSLRKSGGLFKKASEASAPHSALGIKVEARLPSPAILTCHQPIPLKVFVERTNDSPASLYLSMLQIELQGSTNVRAQDVSRTESGSWIIMSQANINLLLDDPTSKSSKELRIPSRFWENIPLPNTVAPSFETCNISRTYEVEIRVGVTHGMADGVRPELAVIPLRIPVQVFSGVAPPQQLLQRMNTNQAQAQAQAQGSMLSPPKPQMPQQASPVTPTTPMHNHGPLQPGTYMTPPQNGADDLPPSYEDAIAEDIGPVDGPRPNFDTSGAPNSTTTTYNPDVKSGSGLNRHPSERLFAQNAPAPPSRRTRPSNLGASEQVPEDPSDSPTTVAEVSNLVEGLNVSQGARAAASGKPQSPPTFGGSEKK